MIKTCNIQHVRKNLLHQFLLNIWMNNGFSTETRFEAFGEDGLTPLFKMTGKKRSVAVAVHMVCQEPTNHTNDSSFA